MPEAIADWQPHNLQGLDPSGFNAQVWAEMDATYDLVISKGVDPGTAQRATRELYIETWSTVKVARKRPGRVP
jgi:hypothetical protein